MNNLITLSCPSCGANLEIISGAKQFSCKYCGNTHVLSNEEISLDSNNDTCPIDSHKDVILKVSAIIKAQTFEAPANSSSGKSITYKSQLAQKLMCPPKPYSPFAFLSTRSGLLFFIFALILLFSFTGNAILSYFFSINSICGFPLFFVIGVFVATPITKNTLIPVLRRKNDKYQKELKQWQAIKKRWDNSFYCQRHDIVFAKDDNQAIPLDKFQSFLWSKENFSKTQK